MYTKIVSISPDYAQELLKNNSLNRPVNQGRVNTYAKDMKEGRWVLNGESIIVSDSNKLLDGQHRLLAIMKSGATIQSLVVYGVKETYFPYIDTGKERNVRDVLSIQGFNNFSWKATAAQKYLKFSKSQSASNVLLRQNKTNTATTNPEVLAFVVKYDELLESICRASRQCYEKINLLTASQIGVYMLYLILDKHHSAETVINFFRQLFRLEPITNNTINVLFDYLNSFRGQRGIDVAAVNQRIIQTWNAFITRKEYKRLYTPKSECAFL